MLISSRQVLTNAPRASALAVNENIPHHVWHTCRSHIGSRQDVAQRSSVTKVRPDFGAVTCTTAALGTAPTTPVPLPLSC